MLCPACGKITHMHMNHRVEWGWSTAHYCEDCRQETRENHSRVCPACQRSLADFYRTGFFGCSQCYSVFAPELDPLLESYHGGGRRTPGGVMEIPPPGQDRLAPARLAEIHQIDQPFGGQTDSSGEKPVDYRTGLSETEGLAMHPVWQAIQKARQAQPFDLATRSSDPVRGILRLRIARNVPDIPYPAMLDENRRFELARKLIGRGSSVVSALREYSIPDQRMDAWKAGHSLLPEEEHGGPAMADFVDPGPLVDAGVLGQEAEGVTVVARSNGWLTILYTGDEDHLRVQWYTPWISGENEWKSILSGILYEKELIERVLAWQFHRDYGYLTACPSHAGHAIRLSLLFSPVALQQSGKWRRWQQEIIRAGWEVRGETGEDSPGGSRVQVSFSRWGHSGGEGLWREIQFNRAILKRLVSSENKARKSVSFS